MRIGILTFHRAHNYGAVLQCYALQTYLQGQGHDVYVIDHEPRSFYRFYNWFVPQLLRVRNPFEFIRRIKLLNAKRKRYDSFVNFIENRLLLCQEGTIFTNPFDVVIVGSDQVWNYTNGFDPYYWGAIKFPKQTTVVSYAASMQDKWEEGVTLVIKELLQNFNKISVRESSLRDSLISLTGNEKIQHVLDPTLLLSGEQWSKLSAPRKIEKSYLLFFYVQYHPEAEKIANAIAAEKHLQFVRLTPDVDQLTSKSVQATTPEDFLSLFQHADFVVSASFHGTVFCLQFKRPFLSFKMGIGKDSRVASLLEPLGLANHFTNQYNPDLDYSCTYDESKLLELKAQSYKYLDSVTE